MKSILFCLVLTLLFCTSALAKTNPNVRLGTFDEIRLRSLRGELADLRADDGLLADGSRTPLSEQAEAVRAMFKKAGIDVSKLTDSQVVAAAKDKRVDVACNEQTYDVTVIQDQPPGGGKAMTLTRRQIPAGKVDDVVSFLTDSMNLACGLNAPAPRAVVMPSAGSR